MLYSDLERLVYWSLHWLLGFVQEFQNNEIDIPLHDAGSFEQLVQLFNWEKSLLFCMEPEVSPP
jgi:hypothetical protein